MYVDLETACDPTCSSQARYLSGREVGVQFGAGTSTTGRSQFNWTQVCSLPRYTTSSSRLLGGPTCGPQTLNDDDDQFMMKSPSQRAEQPPPNAVCAGWYPACGTYNNSKHTRAPTIFGPRYPAPGPSIIDIRRWNQRPFDANVFAGPSRSRATPWGAIHASWPAPACT